MDGQSNPLLDMILGLGQDPNALSQVLAQRLRQPQGAQVVSQIPGTGAPGMPGMSPEMMDQFQRLQAGHMLGAAAGGGLPGIGQAAGQESQQAMQGAMLQNTMRHQQLLERMMAEQRAQGWERLGIAAQEYERRGYHWDPYLSTWVKNPALGGSVKGPGGLSTPGKPQPGGQPGEAQDIFSPEAPEIPAGTRRGDQIRREAQNDVIKFQKEINENQAVRSALGLAGQNKYRIAAISRLAQGDMVPKQFIEDYAIGLARIAGSNGAVANQMVNELKPRGLETDIRGLISYLTSTPVNVNMKRWLDLLGQKMGQENEEADKVIRSNAIRSLSAQSRAKKYAPNALRNVIKQVPGLTDYVNPDDFSIRESQAGAQPAQPSIDDLLKQYAPKKK